MVLTQAPSQHEKPRSQPLNRNLATHIYLTVEVSDAS
jgi:hypothetical protein